jgi:hypothetical protein
VENIEALKQVFSQLETNNKLKIDDLRQNPDKVQKYNNRIVQAKISNYLLANQPYLSYLSAKMKHQWVQQLKKHFTKSEVRSLSKMFYPEKPISILRTTLKVIFGYPVFILRVLAAVGFCLYGRNLNPLRNACDDFGLKILKDVTRVGRALNKFAKIAFSFSRRLAKTFADVFVNSFLARGQAWLADSHAIGNAGYTVSAAVDVNYEKARQLLSTPVDAATRTTTTANPVDLDKKIMVSYMKILKKLLIGKDSKAPEPINPALAHQTNGRPTQEGTNQNPVIPGGLPCFPSSTGR